MQLVGSFARSDQGIDQGRSGAEQPAEFQLLTLGTLALGLILHRLEELELVAAGVVNTMPEKTLEATFDHGVITGDTLTGRYHEPRTVFEDLEAAGVSYHDVVTHLERDGLEKFAASWNDLLASTRSALDKARSC